MFTVVMVSVVYALILYDCVQPCLSVHTQARYTVVCVCVSVCRHFLCIYSAVAMCMQCKYMQLHANAIAMQVQVRTSIGF